MKLNLNHLLVSLLTLILSACQGHKQNDKITSPRKMPVYNHKYIKLTEQNLTKNNKIATYEEIIRHSDEESQIEALIRQNEMKLQKQKAAMNSKTSEEETLPEPIIINPVKDFAQEEKPSKAKEEVLKKPETHQKKKTQKSAKKPLLEKEQVLKLPAEKAKSPSITPLPKKEQTLNLPAEKHQTIPLPEAPKTPAKEVISPAEPTMIKERKEISLKTLIENNQASQIQTKEIKKPITLLPNQNRRIKEEPYQIKEERGNYRNERNTNSHENNRDSYRDY